MFHGFRKFHHFVSLLVFICLLSGCGLPILTPGDANVSERFFDGMRSVGDVSGEISFSYDASVPSDGSMDKKSVRYEGSFRGSFSDKLDISFSEAGGSDCRTIVDIASDRFYVSSGDSWTAYGDAKRLVDSDWWKQALSGNFSYDGIGKSASGNKCYRISRVFSGESAYGLLSHLYLPFFGSYDTSSADLVLSFSIDRFSGRPYDMSLTSSENRNPIVVLDDKSVEWTLSDFSFNVSFSYGSSEPIALPDGISDLPMAVFDFGSGSDDVGSAGPAGKGLVSDDGSWRVSFSDHPVLDHVSIDDKGLHVESSDRMPGDPRIDLYFVSGLDAYNSADSDATVALKYYSKQDGLTDIYVSENVVASTVSGFPSYSYLQQYTDTKYGFVNSEHCTYVQLTDDLSLYIHMSSMVDPGVNNVLNASYADSALSNILIEKSVPVEESSGDSAGIMESEVD